MTDNEAGILLVLKGGLKPPRAKAHRPLKTACLPVPPLQLKKKVNSVAFSVVTTFFRKNLLIQKISRNYFSLLYRLLYQIEPAATF